MDQNNNLTMDFHLKLFIMSFPHFRRPKCNYGSGNVPLYVNVNMKTGETVNTWIDALQAAWSAVQVGILSETPKLQI